MPSDMVQAINELIKGGNADNEPTVFNSPKFNTTNIYPIFQKYFNSDAQKALSNVTQNLVYQWNEKLIHGELFAMLGRLGIKQCKDFDSAYVRRVDLVRFCASRCSEADLPKALEKVILTVNDLASRNYVLATMLPLSIMTIQMAHLKQEYVVMSYIALKQTGFDYAKKNMPKMFAEEGAELERVENQ